MKSNKRDRAGVAAVELAVLLPFIMFLCVISTDWARCLQTTLSAEACARNGALYASDLVTRNMSPYASLQDAAMAECPEYASTATVTQSSVTDSAGNAAIVVTVSIQFKTLTNFPGVPQINNLVRTCQMRVAPLATR